MAGIAWQPSSSLAAATALAAVTLALAVPGGGTLRAQPAPAPPTAWMQFGFDARHSGVNDRETAIHRGNVASLHLLYQVTLPSIADGAPAFLPAVKTARGIKDLLLLTTKDGHLLALDAASGATVWSAQAAKGPAFTTSSPAIDPDRAHVYSYGLDGKVHKYAVANGSEVTTGGWPELATVKPDVEKGSSALAIATAANGTSYLYVASSGYPDDAGDYQGHVTTIDLATGAQQVWNAMCSRRQVHFAEHVAPDCRFLQGAVWARPGVVYDPDLDEIFFATGNGLFDGASGGHEWGDSILALHADGSGAAGGPLDSYTPTNFQELQDQDLDLGSSAPVLLPAPAGSRLAHLAAHCGKDQVIRLLDLDNLSGTGRPGAIGGELQALPLPQGDQVLPQAAAWVDPVDRSTWLFIANFSGIAGLQLVADGAGNPMLIPVWTNHVAGTSPVMADGMLFYAAVGVGLEALDPTTGAVLWTEAGGAGRHWHWESPIVVGGKLYMTDEDRVLRAYAPDNQPLVFHGLPTCRAIDTRGPPGPYGGPAVSGGSPPRLFQLDGQCGVPAGARAVAASLTVVRPSAAGDLRIGPSGVTVDPAVQFRGRARANLPQLLLTGYPAGAVAVQADLPPGATVDVLLDVYGYFD
ncbi:MAG: PQQ-binding-like beta-propeller repeat protein [Acidobacteria bacterium]|nr:PQQ-binding-like beta-propeller repeat protein [Acidobacteriota bacterium]